MSTNYEPVVLGPELAGALLTAEEQALAVLRLIRAGAGQSSAELYLEEGLR